jgi:hypothetical protein
MKFDDSTQAAMFQWLAFPVMGGVPLSAFAAVDFEPKPSPSADGKERTLRSNKKKEKQL